MTTFQVTVLRSGKTGQVLLVEAGKDLVDTLYSFLLLPLGSIVHMLSQGLQVRQVGGISSIFVSVEKLDSFFLHEDKQQHLVQPRPTAAATCNSTKLIRLPALEAALQLPSPPPKAPKKPVGFPYFYYKCNACAALGTVRGHSCHACAFIVTEKVRRPKSIVEYSKNSSYCNGPYAVVLQESEGSKVENHSSSQLRGFVKENISYLVSDDLEILPSTIHSISLLNKLEVASLANLESNHVSESITQLIKGRQQKVRAGLILLWLYQILQILQSALTSTSCLNDVFGKI